MFYLPAYMRIRGAGFEVLSVFRKNGSGDEHLIFRRKLGTDRWEKAAGQKIPPGQLEKAGPVKLIVEHADGTFHSGFVRATSSGEVVAVVYPVAGSVQQIVLVNMGKRRPASLVVGDFVGQGDAIAGFDFNGSGAGVVVWDARIPGGSGRPEIHFKSLPTVPLTRGK